ncbi:conserved hypothetical protein [Lactococcus piscium]|nr:conserved hypothetical protein [Lactococcus piscium]
MKKMFNYLLYVIVVIVLVIVLFFSAVFVTNKVLVSRDRQSVKQYGQQVKVAGHKMTVLIEGEKNKQTIVLLPGFATGSPVIDFSPLRKELSKQFRVVTVEPLGYGLSDTTSSKRSLENMSTELHDVLQALNIKDYSLMGHSISGIYTLDYMNRYPNEVKTFIGIDSSVPNQKGDNADVSQGLSILGNSGFYRFITAVNPEMLNYPPVSDAEKKDFRKISLMGFANPAILSEAKQMATNFNESKKLSYPKDDAVLYILSSDSVKDKTDGDWTALHKEMLTDVKNGQIAVLDGSHYLHHTQSKAIAGFVEQFLATQNTN